MIPRAILEMSYGGEVCTVICLYIKSNWAKKFSTILQMTNELSIKGYLRIIAPVKHQNFLN